MTKPKPATPKYILDMAIAAIEIHRDVVKSEITAEAKQIQREWAAWLEAFARKQQPLADGLPLHYALSSLWPREDGYIEPKEFSITFGTEETVTVRFDVKVPASALNRWNKRLLVLDAKRDRNLDIRGTYIRDLLARHPEMAAKVAKMIDAAIMSEVPKVQVCE